MEHLSILSHYGAALTCVRVCVCNFYFKYSLFDILQLFIGRNDKN